MSSMFRQQIIRESHNHTVTFEPDLTIKETFLDNCIARIYVKCQKRRFAPAPTVTEIRDGILEALQDFKLIKT